MATSTKFDPRPPDRGASAGRGVSGATNTGEGDDHTGEVTDEHLLELVGQAEEISRDDHGSRLSNAIARGARAYRNEHSSESKYNDKINYRGRSRLFVPKTRMAVRKNKAGAAAALFATADVISISAQYDDDPQQLAASSVLKQIVDYRFGTSRPSRRLHFKAVLGFRGGRKRRDRENPCPVRGYRLGERRADP